VGDPLADVLRELRQLGAAVNAEELAEVLWLGRQGAAWGGLPAAPEVRPAAPDVRPAAAGPAGPVPPDAPYRVPRRRRRPGGPSRAPAPPFVAGQLYPGEPPVGADGAPVPYTRVRLPDASALPQARELSRTLRPLRYDPQRTYPADGIDEEATALRIAQAGIRLPVGRTTRRRRLDADLVFDTGGSGPLWTRLAAELRTMLEIHGAFRSVRFWLLDSDSAELPLLPGGAIPAGAGPGPAAGYPWASVCEPPRQPLVIVLTDGTGRCWQTGQMYRPLRDWAVRGTVLAVQLLPEDMWNRAALRALPVAFRSAADGYHSGRRVEVSDVELSVIGLDRDDLSAATAIPVIGLEADWLRSWLPLLRGPEAGVVPGYALLIPPDRPGADDVGHGAPALPGEPAPEVPLTAEDRVHRFTLTASRDARRLARLLSVTTPTLPGLRKIRHELLPASRPGILAEVMLGGLMTWTPATPAAALSGAIVFDFHPGVRDLLRERPGGPAELAWDKALVDRAQWSGPGRGATYDGFVVPAGPDVAPHRAAATETALLPPYPGPGLVAASGGPGPYPPDRTWEPPGELPPVSPRAKPLRIGIWGSPKSGRTTFLTVLGMFFTEWTDGRPGEQWRVQPVNEPTAAFISDCVAALAREKKLPQATIPGEPKPLAFRLEGRRRHTIPPLHWLPPQRLAEITLTIPDRSGGDLAPGSQSAGASATAEADVLVYFFDPTHDVQPVLPKWHSADYLTTVLTELGLAAATGADRLDQPILTKHIAVCVPKLDNQRVFDAAREYGYLETDPRSGLPWVPPRHARRFFEAITYDQESIQADYLRRELSRSFDQKMMSFHALSSVGFWVPEGGQFDPGDVCNVVMEPGAESADEPGTLRGQVRPVHILDPLISLVQRAMKRP